jgi:hypothetical protein
VLVPSNALFPGWRSKECQGQVCHQWPNPSILFDCLMMETRSSTSRGPLKSSRTTAAARHACVGVAVMLP